MSNRLSPETAFQRARPPTARSSYRNNSTTQLFLPARSKLALVPHPRTHKRAACGYLLRASEKKNLCPRPTPATMITVRQSTLLLPAGVIDEALLSRLRRGCRRTDLRTGRHSRLVLAARARTRRG